MSAPQDSTLYHMAQLSKWAGTDTQDYFPPTYEQDGFIHLTADPALLLTVANMFYTDTPLYDGWVVLCIDSTKLKGKVIYEPAAPVGDKESGFDKKDEPVFPHLYAGLNKDAVYKELPMTRDQSSGEFISIQGL